MGRMELTRIQIAFAVRGIARQSGHRDPVNCHHRHLHGGIDTAKSRRSVAPSGSA